MKDPQTMKLKIEALKEIQKALKSCRAGQTEMLEKIREQLKLLSGPTKDRENGGGQENKTAGVETAEIEIDLNALKKRMAEGIMLFWARFQSQFDFENELLKEMRTTISELVDDLSNTEIEELSFQDKHRFATLVQQIMTDIQNFMLNHSYLMRERLVDLDLMKKLKEGLQDMNKRG